MAVEKVGRLVEINHEGTWWDGLKGEVVAEAERYPVLAVNVAGTDWRSGVWPFLAEEVRFISRSGGRR